MKQEGNHPIWTSFSLILISLRKNYFRFPRTNELSEGKAITGFKVLGGILCSGWSTQWENYLFFLVLKFITPLKGKWWFVGSTVEGLEIIKFLRNGSWTWPIPGSSITHRKQDSPHRMPMYAHAHPSPHHVQASYMYTFRMRSSFVSPVSRSAILRTAQPKGRRYWALQAFFFSPAPIRPVQGESTPSSRSRLINPA